MGFMGVILGVGANIVDAELHPSSELHVFRHLSPDLTRRAVALCIYSHLP